MGFSSNLGKLSRESGLKVSSGALCPLKHCCSWIAIGCNSFGRKKAEFFRLSKLLGVLFFTGLCWLPLRVQADSPIIHTQLCANNRLAAKTKALPSTAANKQLPAVKLVITESPPPAKVRLPQADYDKPLFISESEAVVLALKTNPRLKISLAQLEAAKGRTRQAASQLGSTLDLSASYQAVQPLSGQSNLTNEGDVAAQWKQLLWDGKQSSSKLKSCLALQGAAELSCEEAEREISRDVRLAYYRLLAQRRLSEAARDNLNNCKSNLQLARAKWETGSGLPADVVRAESQLATATLKLNEERAKSVSCAIQLADLLGLALYTVIEPQPPFAFPLNETDTFEKLCASALEERPDVQYLQLKIKAAEYLVKQAEGESFPELYASAGVSGANNGVWPPRSWQAFAGLTMQWQVSDAGLRKGEIEEAEANQRVSEAELEVKIKAVQTEIYTNSIKLRTALQSLSAADAAQSNASEAVRIAQGRYAAGLGTFLEVNDAQDSLISSSNSLTEALLTVWEARINLDYSLGRSGTYIYMP